MIRMSKGEVKQGRAVIITDMQGSVTRVTPTLVCEVAVRQARAGF